VFVTATVLLAAGKLTGAEWGLTLFGVGLICLALSVIDRVEKLTLGAQSELRLREVKQVERNIYAKEQALRETTLAVLELMDFQSIGVGRGQSEETRRLEAQGLHERRKRILGLLDVQDDVWSDYRAKAGYAVSSPFQNLGKGDGAAQANSSPAAASPNGESPYAPREN
jgi:hypothetical protein